MKILDDINITDLFFRHNNYYSAEDSNQLHQVECLETSFHPSQRNVSKGILVVKPL